MCELEEREFAEPLMEKPRLKSGERKRPVGVTVIAIWNIVGAVLMGLIGLAGTREVEDPATAVVASVFVIGLTVLAIVVSIGLLRLRNWARITTIVLYGINVLFGVIELAFGKNPSGILGLGIALTILIYLNREHVREAFASHIQETSLSSPSEALGKQTQTESRSEPAHY